MAEPVNLDKNRAFDISDMEALSQKTRALLEACYAITEEMQKTIDNTSDIYSCIPGEYKYSPLGATIGSISGTLKKEDFRTSLDEIVNVLSRLIQEVPEYDTRLADKVANITDTMTTLKERYDDLCGLFEGLKKTDSYESFKKELGSLLIKWQETESKLPNQVYALRLAVLGYTMTSPDVADPVNSSTGNFVYDREDIRIGGRIPLTFHRYYNAQDDRIGALGRRFSHSYEIDLYRDEEDIITIHMEDGNRKTYKPIRDEADKITGYVGMRAAKELLSEVESEESEYHYVLTRLDGFRYCFDIEGKLLREENLNKEGFSLGYDDSGRLIKVTSDYNTYLEYSYNGDNFISKVTDHAGREVCINYVKRRIEEVILPDGCSYIYHYGKNGCIEEITNARDVKVLQNTYDDDKRIIVQHFPDGGVTYIEYNDNENEVAVTERNGVKTAYVHDDKYRNIETRYHDGSKEISAYNDRDQRISYTDRNGNTYRYAYDDKGNITQILEPTGIKRNLTYDANNHLISLKIDGVRYIDNTYDNNGNLIKMKNAGDKDTCIEYDSLGRPIMITEPNGAKTTVIYGDDGNVKSITDAEGSSVCYEYDNLNRPIASIDPMGYRTSYEYDINDNLVSVMDAENHLTKYVYNQTGKLTRYTDANGNTIDYKYNVLGKVSEITDKLENKTELTYDSMWNIKCIKDSRGKTTSYHYDKDNRPDVITYHDGSIEKYTYDAVGNVKTYTDRAGVTITYNYDCLNRVTKICGENGESKKYTYDVLGNVTSITDTLGNTTRYEYTPMGKLSKVTDALGYETEYTYDECDRLIHIKQTGDGDTRRTGYERDLLGRVTAVTDIKGGREEYTYNRRGELICKLDKEENLTSYEYTPAGDISHIRYADGREVKLSYDALRKLTEIKDWLGITKITKDVLGRAIEVTYPDNRKVSYTYGSSGERTSITYPDGRTTYYGYDDNLRLSELKVGDEIITYDYDSIGRLIKKTLQNGITSEYGYDKRGLIASFIHRDDEGILDSYRYTYDLSGNKIGIDKSRRGVPEDTGLFTYTYDPIGRLSTVSRDDNLLRSYAYDAYGNRIKLTEQDRITSYTYNSLNQLISKTDEEEGSSDITSYTYDRRGNLIGVYENDTLMHSYAYDPTNRIKRATNQSGEVATYIYDGLGHRVGKTETRIKTHADIQNAPSTDIPNPTKKIDYLIDVTRDYYNLLEKTENDCKQSYIWDGNVVGAIDGDNTSIDYLLQDELGSTIRNAGQNNEAYAYDEFGIDILNNQGIYQPFGYTGYQYDSISDTYFAQAREYTPNIGRFAGRDIIKGYQDRPYTLNEYLYCFDSPEALIDLDGNRPYSAYITGPRIIKQIDREKMDELWWDACDALYEPMEFVAEHNGVFISSGIIGLVTAGAIASRNPKLALVAVDSAKGAITNGFQNKVTGGTFNDGFVGGAIGGATKGTIDAVSDFRLSIGGVGIAAFITNEVTEHLNVYHDAYKKNDYAIHATSLTMAVNAAALDGLFGYIGKVDVGNMGAIRDIFKYSLEFTESLSVYIPADYIFTALFDKEEK